MRALVLDPGNSRSALAGVRALAHAGWVVGVASPYKGMAARSRWAVEFARVPSSTDIAAVDKAVRAGRWDVIVPAGDAEAFAVSLGRDSLQCRVPYAEHSVVAKAFDKAELAEVARGCGVATPAVVTARSSDVWPVVVKGRSHVAGRHEAVVARTRQELDAAVAGLAEPVVQEFVDGPLVAMSVVADSTSAVVARVQQRAVAVWPSPAGVSTRAETTAVDPELSAAVDRMVTGLGWVGLAQFQFIVGPDGVARLIDCNGRLYGSLGLALAAGVNLPAIWLGWPPMQMPAPEARVGARYQWLEGDLRRAPGRALDSLAYGIRARHSIISLRDPTPFMGHVADLALRAVRKAVRR